MKLFLDGMPRITQYDDNAVLVLNQMDEDGVSHNIEIVLFPEEAIQVGALLQAYGQKLLAND